MLYKVIKSIHESRRGRWDVFTTIAFTHCSPWKSIFQVQTLLTQLICFQVGDGSRVLSWKDMWMGDQLSASKFPRLYNLSTRYNTNLSTFILNTNGSFSWNFHFTWNLYDGETCDILSLLDLLESTHLSLELDNRT